jgi:AhpD family alkylhydroperoxidase
MDGPILNWKNTFKKRTYCHPGELLGDTAHILGSRKKIKALMRGESLDKKFRERLMLAVTEVNGCRYCQFAHARMALSCGLSRSEIDDLSSGVLDNCPAEQVPALLYAQHWAESNANPDPHIRQSVMAVYGDETMQAIELSLYMIRMGNLLGNSWDYLLYRLSFGRRGAVERNPA